MNRDHRHTRPLFFRIFGWLWRAIKAYLMLIGLLVVLMPLLFGVFFNRFSSTELNTTRPSDEPFILHLSLEGEITSEISEPETDLWRLLVERRQLIRPRSIASVLEYAAQDELVKGVLVEVQQLSGDLSGFMELRRAFEEFTASGKPLHFNITYAGNGDYLLATVADEISLTPTGDLSVTGPVLIMPYFAETLKKLGLEFEVFQAGRFKTVFEPFIRNSPSPASMEMLGELEASLRRYMVEIVAGARHVDYDNANAWLKQGLFLGSDALSAGLVDQLEYLSDHIERFKVETETDAIISFSRYRPYALSKLAESFDIDQSGNALAIVEAYGEIHLYSKDSHIDNTVITPANINPQLQWAREDDEVKAVVLRISSPGGSATASDIIWEEVRKLAKVKPVVVSMGDTAASGGYYIAAPATRIVAEPSTITGSIGVISAIPIASGVREKFGVSFHTITQSDRARLMHPSQRPSDFDRTLMQTMVQEFYREFIEKVASGRHRDVTEIDEIAQGRVYTGRQALEIGLVDDVGGLDVAFRLAKELAELDVNKRYPLKQYKAEPADLLSCLRAGGNLLRCLQHIEASAPRFLSDSLLEQFTYPGVDHREIRRIQGWIKLATEEDKISLTPLSVSF